MQRIREALLLKGHIPTPHSRGKGAPLLSSQVESLLHHPLEKDCLSSDAPSYVLRPSGNMKDFHLLLRKALAEIGRAPKVKGGNCSPSAEAIPWIEKEECLSPSEQTVSSL